MIEELNRKWEKCLEIFRDNIGAERTKTWFESSYPVGYENDKLKLRIPSRWFYEKYEDDFYNLLYSTIKKVFGEKAGLRYELRIIENDDKSKVTIDGSRQSHTVNNRFLQSMQSKTLVQEKTDKTPDFDPQLNESLTFENYCVGESNKIAYTIAEYIANNPGKNDFNPFFLYGDVGVGKTHLIQAIGIRIKEKFPRKKVLFITLRQFQNLYANATIKKDIPAFINWFQQIDVLLIDDLQEISHKDGTVNVLFPIFNHLHLNGKALIFTCDRPPMELDGVTDRLIDRFKWGITEKLNKPDYELKKKILEFKASKNGLSLPEEVIELIARQSTGSIRELEGIVMGILTRSIAFNCQIDVNLANEVMKHSIKVKKAKTVNFDMIVEATAEHYGLNVDAIFSKSRLRDVAEARQIIMYLSHKLTNLSLIGIGKKLKRSHTTVLYGIEIIEGRLPFSKELNSTVNAIEEELKK